MKKLGDSISYLLKGSLWGNPAATFEYPVIALLTQTSHAKRLCEEREIISYPQLFQQLQLRH